MIRPAFKQQITGDGVLDQAFRDADAARKSVARSGIELGRLAFDTDPDARDISFTAATAKRLMHGLGLRSGATPTGFFPVYTSAACTFYVSAWDANSITVVPSATCTGRLWVFP